MAPAQTVEELLKSAAAALARRQADEALTLADRAVKADPANTTALVLRGQAQGLLRRPALAIADYDKALALDPKLSVAYDLRGSERFKMGEIAGSLADFDRFLELTPAERNGHWRRGITLYYAGKFDEGRKQFEGYEKVDTNDVENAIWHYLCNARAVGVEKARGQLLKIGKDKRVPMMEVYALFKGERKPDEVLTAARAGQPAAAELHTRLFYAHLYLGLYHEALGDRKQALEHLTKAAQDYPIAHYMGDVARVHVELLKKAR
jgi:lipoprotein NlpI